MVFGQFGKIKYNRGHPVDGAWVFGMFERGTSQCCMLIVEKRDSKTLIPLIEKYVKPGRFYLL